MKKNRKHWKLPAMVVLLVMALFSGLVNADSTRTIKVNTAYSGHPEERKFDLYEFKLSGSGKLNVKLTHENLYEKDVYWTVEVLAGDLETVLQTFNSTGTDASLTGASLGLTKGTYYVKVYARKDCGHKFSDKPYSMTVQFKRSNKWEIEYDSAKKKGNDSQGTATAMKSNQFSYGTVSSDKDVDFFKLKVTKNGYLMMNFRHPNIYEKDVYWNVQLMNNKVEKMYEINSTGIKKSSFSAKIGVTPGTYFVRVASGGSGRFSDRDYRVKLTFTKSSAWEKEYTSKTNKYNNIMSNANKLKFGKTITGSISTENDVDYYRFTTSMARQLSINFAHQYRAKRQKYWKISLVNSNLKTIMTFTSKGFNSSLTKRVYIGKGTYFLKVEKSDKWLTNPYTVTLK